MARMTHDSEAQPDRDPMIGRTVDGRYRVISALARGGMSRVYRAEQHPLGRTVALKVMAVSGDDDQEAEFRRRFQLEASVSARLTHPNTVRVFDHGAVGDELLYIAMEYLDGRTLHQVIKAEAPLSATRVVNLARQMCGSLREAHSLSLIHRDLKPANVVLMRHGDDEDFVKVLDFGLVKHLRTNDELTGVDAVVGSPSFMSPEQIRAERLDGRTDIYSLGVILYACVAGKPPFVADTSVGVLLAHLNHEPPTLNQNTPALLESPSLQWVILTCLAKNAADRFADIDEVIRALRICEAELRGEAWSPSKLSAGRIVREEARASRPARAAVPAEPSGSTIISAIRSRRVPLLAATGAFAGLATMGALVLTLVLGVWAWKQRTADPVAAPATPAVAVPAAPFGPVRLSSVPDGARLTRGGVALGVAPLDLAIPQGEVWEVSVEADGYAATAIRVPWDARRQEVILRPDPAPARARPTIARKDDPVPVAPAEPEPVAAPPAGSRSTGDLKDPWSP
ncbi:MAG: PEGA domain-containing protein [Myxococcales bacterium]|nr:PEGA domain-containing protein [Myxococcales bacterium]